MTAELSSVQICRTLLFVLIITWIVISEPVVLNNGCISEGNSWTAKVISHFRGCMLFHAEGLDVTNWTRPFRFSWGRGKHTIVGLGHRDSAKQTALSMVPSLPVQPYDRCIHCAKSDRLQALF